MDNIDVYWSFRSPYSYLATPDMLQLAQDYQVGISLRVVFPIAIRAPEMLFNPANANRTRYILQDWTRRAEFLGMPCSWPNPDPIVQDMKTMKIAEDQPHIFRLSALGVEAQRRGKGPEFAHAVSHMIWSGTADWHLGDHLSEASLGVGLDLAGMEVAIDGGDHLQEVERNQQALDTAGGWGVPTFSFRDEIFFGQDRVETLRWRLDQCGLANHG